MSQPRQPLPDEFEMGADGAIRDTETGEIFGHVPIGLRDLYNTAPKLLAELQKVVNWIEMNGNTRVKDYSRVCLDARAVIAEAKGGA